MHVYRHHDSVTMGRQTKATVLKCPCRVTSKHFQLPVPIPSFYTMHATFLIGMHEPGDKTTLVIQLIYVTSAMYCYPYYFSLSLFYILPLDQ